MLRQSLLGKWHFGYSKKKNSISSLWQLWYSLDFLTTRASQRCHSSWRNSMCSFCVNFCPSGSLGCLIFNLFFTRWGSRRLQKKRGPTLHNIQLLWQFQYFFIQSMFIANNQITKPSDVWRKNASSDTVLQKSQADAANQSTKSTLKCKHNYLEGF